MLPCGTQGTQESQEPRLVRRLCHSKVTCAHLRKWTKWEAQG